MAAAPVRILRDVPALIEFGRGLSCIRLGAREIEFEQASTRASRDVGVAAEIARVEEAKGLRGRLDAA